MSLLKGLLLGGAVSVLAGCSHWDAGPDARFTRWVCEQPDFIEWRHPDAERQFIELRVGAEGQIQRLQKEPAIQGTFYSDGIIAFHDRGTDALVFRLSDDRVIARGCRASLFNF
ncbi:hypothetical protein [Stutzerimonas tarimensis]|uniref:C-type lysozyme inhibitor domain-containing protein n=1 Tax=Stutzerimonas tarimensis TaxID=1507735 RepID=A0ABV7T6D8_9GAMM